MVMMLKPQRTTHCVDLSTPQMCTPLSEPLRYTWAWVENRCLQFSHTVALSLRQQTRHWVQTLRSKKFRSAGLTSRPRHQFGHLLLFLCAMLCGCYYCQECLRLLSLPHTVLDRLHNAYRKLCPIIPFNVDSYRPLDERPDPEVSPCTQ